MTGKLTGDSRGFAFVRYKYADEAQKAVERLDGRVVDGREITVQFAKYGPNAERIHKGRIAEPLPKSRYRSRSRSPRRRYRDDYRDQDYGRRSRSRNGRDRDYYRRSRSPSASPDYYRSRGRGRYYDDSRSRSRSIDSASPARRSHAPRRSLSPLSRSGSASPDGRGRDRSPASRSFSPRGRLADSRSPSPRHSDDD